MDKELRGLVVEIISIIFILIIAVPICVNASSNYRMKKEAMLNGGEIATVDISNRGETKKVTVYSNQDKLVRVNLILKTSKFSDKYLVVLDGTEYELDSLQSSEDEEYRYYLLGTYDVDQKRQFDFKLKVKDKIYYDEDISYSFVTEV